MAVNYIYFDIYSIIHLLSDMPKSHLILRHSYQPSLPPVEIPSHRGRCCQEQTSQQYQVPIPLE